MLVSECLKEHTHAINTRLEELISPNDAPYALLFEAARYSLLGEGKRLRPLLTLVMVDVFGGDISLALTPACVIEMIHTYSLIHDDLPCMDDDDLRRGRPTLHKAYPEAIAVLAGDYLLTYAFECLGETPGLNDAQRLHLIQILSQRAGAHGMIGGQVMDMLCEKRRISLSMLERLHLQKTAALITASLEFGCVLARQEESLPLIMELGLKIGLAFQMVDDILDATSSVEILGKQVQADAKHHKSTYVSLLGVDKAQEEAQRLYSESQGLLQQLPGNTTPLEELFQRMVFREK